MTLKQAQFILIGEIAMGFLISAIAFFLFESHVFSKGIFAYSKTKEFIFVTCMELLTLGLIPLALYLFKFDLVSRSLKKDGAQSLLKWGTLRIMLLMIPMLLNIFFYFLFGNPTFCYMAIVFFLSLFFIFPTKNRCLTETEN